MNTLKSLRLPPMIEILSLVLLVAVLAVVLPHTAGSLPLVGLGFAGMILDAQLVLSDAQALVATAVSTNTFDSGAAGTDVTSGEPLCLLFTVDVAASLGNANETYQFQAIQAASADLLTSQEILVQTDTGLLTRAALVAGKRFFLPLPPGSKTRQYLGARYVLGGTNPTITVSCEIQPLSMVQNDYINATGILIDS